MAKIAHTHPVVFKRAELDLIYDPRKTWDEDYCPCVYVCDRFKDYKKDYMGRRIIPYFAECPFAADGRCKGDLWYNRSNGNFRERDKFPYTVWTNGLIKVRNR